MTIRLPPVETVARAAWRNGRFSRGTRHLVEETPVALTYDGTSYAVMMTTPADLHDFAIGFSLSEGVIDSLQDIESLELVDVEDGVEARMWLGPDASKRHTGRRRSILGPTGCGLCGVDSIAEAMKPVPRVENGIVASPKHIIDAMSQVQRAQALHAKTWAVHAAALWIDGSVVVREDVGRHNALDKLIGAAAADHLPARNGAVLLTSRVSVELVQKTARLGASIIAAVSAPTALAVRVAEAAGITLVAVLRDDGFEIFTHGERILDDADANVA